MLFPHLSVFKEGRETEPKAVAHCASCIQWSLEETCLVSWPRIALER